MILTFVVTAYFPLALPFMGGFLVIALLAPLANDAPFATDTAFSGYSSAAYVELRKDGSVFGDDAGIIQISSGRLSFSGRRCSFTLLPRDVTWIDTDSCTTLKTTNGIEAVIRTLSQDPILAAGGAAAMGDWFLSEFDEGARSVLPPENLFPADRPGVPGALVVYTLASAILFFVFIGFMVARLIR
ncbi:MAG TPA: hypothetical protein VGE01_12210 [Fimbriimonas sp.]